MLVVAVYEGYRSHLSFVREIVRCHRRGRRLHGRLARWIEDRGPRCSEASTPATLAYHFERAECWAKAFTYSMRAGHQALRMSATPSGSGRSRPQFTPV